MKVRTYLLARFYEVRARKAFQKYLKLKKKKEKFFHRLGISPD